MKGGDEVMLVAFCFLQKKKTWEACQGPLTKMKCRKAKINLTDY